MKKIYTKPEINKTTFTQVNETSIERSRVLVLKEKDALKFSKLNA